MRRNLESKMTNYMIGAALLLSFSVFGCRESRMKQSLPNEIGASKETKLLAAQTDSQTAAAEATASLKTKDGQEVGKLSLRQHNGKVTIDLQVHGLEAGKHGFHFHERGECQPPDFQTAGDHFNPTRTKHGGPEDKEHHAGDFGNLTVSQDGTGKLNLTTDQISLGSVIGRSIIIHSGVDDLQTQPAGNSGARLACGVVVK